MAEFNAQEVAWKDLEVSIFNKRLRGFRELKIKVAVEKEHLYADGQEPFGIQEGNVTYTGSVKVLKSTLRSLNDAAKAAGYSDVTRIPHQAIVMTAYYASGFGRASEKKTLAGVSFSEFEESMAQGAKFMEVDLPFLFMGFLP